MLDRIEESRGPVSFYAAFQGRMITSPRGLPQDAAAALLDAVFTDGFTPDPIEEETILGQIDLRNPRATAAIYLALRCRAMGPDGRPRLALRHWGGETWFYDGRTYAVIDKSDLRAKLYSFIGEASPAVKAMYQREREADAVQAADDARRLADLPEAERQAAATLPAPKKSKAKDATPTDRKISALLDALIHTEAVRLGSDVTRPCWIGSEGGDAESLIVFNNCVLDAATGEQHPHTPDLFSDRVIPYDYDPEARCDRWLRYLEETWPDAEDRVRAQQIAGQLLYGSADREKAFLLVGKPRNGKGTFAETLCWAAGIKPSGLKLGALGSRFGLAPFAQDRIIFIDEAVLAQKDDKNGIMATFLAMVGGSNPPWEEKNRPGRRDRTAAQFIITCNAIPALVDNSGAFAERIVPLGTFGPTIPDHGRDPQLKRQLRSELPGIAAWALAGYRQVLQLGGFSPAAESDKILDEVREVASPTLRFIREQCSLDPTRQGFVTNKVLWEVYQHWRSENTYGSKATLDKATFIRQLRQAAAQEGVQLEGRRVGGRGLQERAQFGICLNGRDTREPDGSSPYSNRQGFFHNN